MSTMTKRQTDSISSTRSTKRTTMYGDAKKRQTAYIQYQVHHYSKRNAETMYLCVWSQEDKAHFHALPTTLTPPSTTPPNPVI